VHCHDFFYNRPLISRTTKQPSVKGMLEIGPETELKILTQTIRSPQFYRGEKNAQIWPKFFTPFPIVTAWTKHHTALQSCLAVYLRFFILQRSSTVIFLTSLAVQFYLGFCSKSGTLVAQLASCQCLRLSSSANHNRMNDKTV